MRSAREFLNTLPKHGRAETQHPCSFSHFSPRLLGRDVIVRMLERNSCSLAGTGWLNGLHRARRMVVCRTADESEVAAHGTLADAALHCGSEDVGQRRTTGQL